MGHDVTQYLVISFHWKGKNESFIRTCNLTSFLGNMVQLKRKRINLLRKRDQSDEFY